MLSLCINEHARGARGRGTRTPPWRRAQRRAERVRHQATPRRQCQASAAAAVAVVALAINDIATEQRRKRGARATQNAKAVNAPRARIFCGAESSFHPAFCPLRIMLRMTIFALGIDQQSHPFSNVVSEFSNWRIMGSGRGRGHDMDLRLALVTVGARSLRRSPAPRARCMPVQGGAMSLPPSSQGLSRALSPRLGEIRVGQLSSRLLICQ